jgi:hypothetical protein
VFLFFKSSSQTVTKPAMFGSSWLVFTTLAVSIVTIAERVPREVKWSDESLGPDGPWRAASVNIAGSEIALYPGSTWETWLITESYCSSGSICYASQAGLFDVEDGDSGGIGLEADPNNFNFGVEVIGGKTTRLMTDITMNGITAENVSLALINTQEVGYPGGQTSPFFAGCLAMGGSKGVNQSFGWGDNDLRPAINASLVPGWMWENAWTPSNSFGMHIGSVEPPMPGSLYFGGYDQNRVIGDVLSLSGGPRDGITLRDISIDVSAGQSPWEFESKDGLLAKGNSSIGSGLKVLVDGCSPYLTLPKSTCDNIAEQLPVKYDDDLGLYLWETDSDKYKDIVTSPSSLTFTFIAGSNTDTVEIRVPFMHLNLTLTAPLVDSPTPYFPCHVSRRGQYVLGRAFLQDAFVGANWHDKANTWWLAQAPGSNIQATTNVVSIGEEAKTIDKSSNSWEASWEGVWSEIEAKNEEDNKTTPSDPSPTGTDKDKNEGGNNNDEDDDGGLSTGAMAGIGVGVGLGVIGLAILGFVLWRRRRANHKGQQSPIVEADTVAAQYKPPYQAAPHQSYQGYQGPPHQDFQHYAAPPPLPPQELHSQSHHHAAQYHTEYQEMGTGATRYS